MNRIFTVDLARQQTSQDSFQIFKSRRYFAWLEAIINERIFSVTKSRVVEESLGRSLKFLARPRRCVQPKGAPLRWKSVAQCGKFWIDA